MRTLVIYDITDDRIRNLVSEICKNFGLSRIQKSAFLGKLSSSRRKELSVKLKKALGNAKGNIQIFVICEADLALREIIGQEYHEEEEEGLVVL